MKLLPILLLSIAGVCVGQQPHVDCVGGQCPAPFSMMTSGTNGKPTPAPLKCGKYEHVYSFCDEQKRTAPNTGPCFDDGPPRCVPDLHTVTEKEWQELMERLRRLEHPPLSSTMPFVPDAK